MLKHERKLQVLDLIVIIALIFFGCVLGKLGAERYGSVISLNGSMIGVLLIGEFIWYRVKKWLIKKWEED